MFDHLNRQVNDLVKETLEQDFKEATRDQLKDVRLDPRAMPCKAWFSDDTLVIRKSDERLLNYYGGFEYVDDRHRKTLGDYVMFSDECSRVSSILATLNGDEEEDEDESES